MPPGISRGQDAYGNLVGISLPPANAIEFIMAGASAIQVGTANLTNPRTPLDILQGIEQFMEKEGINNLTDLIGAARR